jgi:PAS domain S-box-containing protein
MNIENQNQSIRILFAGYTSSDLSKITDYLKGGRIQFISRIAETEDDFKKEMQLFSPEVVISEYNNQNFNGFTALNISKALHPGTHFIFFTSTVNEEIAVTFLKAVTNDYLLKTNLTQLARSVIGIMKKRGNSNKLTETESKTFKSEDIYFALHENSVNGIFILKDKKIELINPAFEKIFGYSSWEISQPHFDYQALIAPESKLFIESVINQILTEEKTNLKFDFKILTKKGDVKEVEALISKIYYEGKEIIQGTIQDITHRKIIEEKLTESEKKFRLLFQNHTAVKLLIDSETGKIIEANKAAAKFYGWSKDELKTMNISQINLLSHDEFRLEIQKLNKHENIVSEFTHLNATGKLVDVEVHSSKIYFDEKEVIHHIIHDISGKKLTEQKLQLLNTAVEQNPLTIVITNPQGEIEYINPAFTEMTGYQFSDVTGRTLSVLKSGLQEENFYKDLWNTISSGRAWTNEYRNKKKNGEIYWQETTITPILNEKGIITHFVAVMEDISREKRMIEDLLIAKEKAEESDRLKSAFLANMSHEIRTPMNGIIGFTNLLKEQKLTGDDKKMYINIIKKSSERMLNTINDLIEISKIESGTMDFEFSELNINEMLDFQKHFFLSEITKKGLNFSCIKPFPMKLHELKQIMINSTVFSQTLSRMR